MKASFLKKVIIGVTTVFIPALNAAVGQEGVGSRAVIHQPTSRGVVSPDSARIRKIWQDRFEPFNGPSSFRNVSLVLDAEENLYAGGTNPTKDSNDDFVVSKFDRAGKKLWSSGFGSTNNGGNCVDVLAAIAVTKEGEVYAAGTTSDGIYTDFTTIKFNADGKKLWSCNFDGPIHENDTAVGMVVDDGGNAFVTGCSQGKAGNLPFGVQIVAYSRDGRQTWAKRFEGSAGAIDYPVGIGLDRKENIYVGVMSSSGSDGLFAPAHGDDYVVLKYDLKGKVLWAARYDGGAQVMDTSRAMCVSGDGDVYLTGVSAGPAATTDVTARFSDRGKLLWKGSSAPSSGFKPSAIAVDQAKNVFVAGSVDTFGAGLDYQIVAFDANGAIKWKATHNGVGNGDDLATGLVLDPGGNAYFTGCSAGKDGFFDFATVKVSPIGQIVWVARFSHSDGSAPLNHFSDYLPSGILIDKKGNVFVGGMADGTVLVIKYDNDGKQMWTRR